MRRGHDYNADKNGVWPYKAVPGPIFNYFT